MSYVDNTKIKCTCGMDFAHHRSGRCMDAILHRLLFQEEPRLAPAGTTCYDGLRDNELFESDWVYERKGELHLLPAYTSSPAQAFALFARWNELGGMGTINFNRSDVSASFRHTVVTLYWSYAVSGLKRSKVEWIPGRLLAPRVIEYLIGSNLDTCRWIDGIVDGHP